MDDFRTASDAARSFNARWLTPEEVARYFVPVDAYQQLVGANHAVLLGPRGSGKTTLLKMLTRPALKSWEERTRENDDTEAQLDTPLFEAVYIPSDSRWSIELAALGNDAVLGSETARVIQRYLVTAGAVLAVVRAVRSLCADDSLLESNVVRAFVDTLGVGDRPATLAQLATIVRRRVSEVRGTINRRKQDETRELAHRIPSAWIAHPVDIPIALCESFDALASARVRGGRWALCFDELEIAPEWLKNELLVAVRSVDQPFVLKLTWRQILPQELLGQASLDEDITPIRLWSSEAHQARAFADKLASRFIHRTFGAGLTPGDWFGHSRVHEDPLAEATTTKYEQGSQEYEDMKALAEQDASFRSLLIRKKVNPLDPVVEESRLLDTLHRKVRPVVIARLAFLNEQGIRGRKNVPEIYSGVEVIYDVCEGNPRWLNSLLSDLYNAWRSDGAGAAPSRDAQGRAIRMFALRFRDEMLAKRVPHSQNRAHGGLAIGDLADRIGNAMANGLLRGEFPLDPVGSFRMDAGASGEVKRLVEAGLDQGAFVYIGGSAQDGSNMSLDDARLRVSYRLAPLYRLPLRQFRDVALSGILQRVSDPDQLAMFRAPEE